MQKELPVAGITRDRRLHHGCARQSYLSGRACRFFHDPGLHERIADDTFLAHLGAPGLELRFDERHDIGAGAQHRRYARKDVAE